MSKSKGTNVESVGIYKPKPSISLSESDLGGLENMEIGKKYKFDVEAELTYLEKGSEWDESPRKTTRGRFRITNISCEDAKVSPKPPGKIMKRIGDKADSY